jgi:hypothetical protein
MAVLKRRSRMISFRLSEEEYTSLRSLCINEGARSVSDLARDALSRLVTKTPNGSSPYLETTVRTMQSRIDAMDMELKRLSQAVQTPAATNGTAAE